MGLVGLQCHLVVDHICWRQALVGASATAEGQLVLIGGAQKEGSGRGCFAPLDCEVKGLQPVLMSTRMSR